MAQVLVNIRMDEDLKKSMEQTCQALGINMTTAFTIFAKKMSREKRIPFEVSVDPFYSKSNMVAIDEAAKQIERGQVVEAIKKPRFLREPDSTKIPTIGKMDGMATISDDFNELLEETRYGGCY